MRMRSLRSWVVVAMVIVLAGCVTVPKTELRSGGLKPGQSVTLVESPPVKQFFFYGFHPGMAFGAIGGLIAGSQFEQRAKDLLAMTESQGVQASPVLTGEMRHQLERAGLQVRAVTVPWIEKNGQLVPDLSAIGADHTQVLVLLPMTVGFAAWYPHSDYLPLVRIRATLYGPDRSAVLYDAQHVNGWNPDVLKGAVEIPRGLPGVRTYDELTAKPSTSAVLLRDAVERAARSIAGDLQLSNLGSASAPRDGAPVVAGPPAAEPVAAPAAPSAPMVAARPPAPQRVVAVAAPSTPVVAVQPVKAAPPPASTGRNGLSQVATHWQGFMDCELDRSSASTVHPEALRMPVTLKFHEQLVTMQRGDDTYSETTTGHLSPTQEVVLRGTGSMRATPAAVWHTQVAAIVQPGKRRLSGSGTVMDASGSVARRCKLVAEPV